MTNLRTAPISTQKLESLTRDELLVTVRRLLAEADALASRISAVHEIGVAVNRTLDVNEILRVVGKQAKWLLDFEHCSVCLRDENGRWRLRTLFGPAIELLLEGMAIESMPTVGAVLKTGQSHLIRDDKETVFLRGYASQMLIALQSDHDTLGTINFASRQPNRYTQDDLRIGYMLSLQLSAAIRNAQVVRALNEAKAELEARNQELDAFSYTVAHDLKGPINNISLQVDLLVMRNRNALNDQLRQRIGAIKEAAFRMSDMIDQLLLLARVRHVQEAAVEVNMNITASSALARFQATLENQPFTIDFKADLPPALAQPQWVEEIFANLISNAIKYMGDKNPAPTITLCAQPEGDYIRYNVRDNGIGISPENQKRLFVMFSRLNTISADGLGLGLAIVARIINRLGGKVGVESNRDQGSTFWFTLPAVKKAVE
ncbi:MAG: ATP-binding protein [bacterium]|nr:ATP-binding protein [bacterium]